ncbi:MAG: bifunctional 2-polyprenyl-6-hydroxyphenol methylase/3-demethylubiquinol 3-O-methyltransferase UbiG [Sphingopyxis sp.]
MTTTITASEADHFGKLAADWWNPKGSSAMLHRLNPARLGFIRDAIDAQWRIERTVRRPLTGKRALDVGCGAGLLSEPLARLGADVVGVDAAAQNVAVASAHASAQGLAITYAHGDIGDAAFAAPLGSFDLITCMEVIEHVADPAAFIAALAARVSDDGLLILSTPNRTGLSKLLLVEAAERLGHVPRGTHDWARFITPDEMTALMEDAGLRVIDTTGLGPSLSTRGFRTGGSMALDYLVSAVRG